MKQNKTQLVERHIIKSNDKRFAQIKDFCHLSKNLYNYILRQEFITNKSIPKEYDLSKSFAMDNQVDYRALPAQSAQLIIKLG